MYCDQSILLKHPVFRMLLGFSLFRLLDILVNKEQKFLFSSVIEELMTKITQMEMI